ncbi:MULTISPECIES: PTS sugar transporter subunit IIB [Staphylococcus]|uniref:PTS sugar transporter subunit IIB n=3 Tax=Staphylococcus cohnii species complex TaxID=3239053 RepID=A0AB34AL99_STAUR|nr:MULTISPECIES: PTS sugar transporter subunit IIB [Staphylococcus]TGP64648.1 PTS sugar transporter subunit IIB [bacterium M00.F.Ca.ET.229.01.1.1]TGS41142.1 PTS sugar transporter subunit IIB [bacterium M00.F.Ca.ET.180.01.1.1]KKI63047.1 PTS system, diacetylchitobiose-specific IIB component [Staphylococcus cohnii subsp. cohnii]MCE5033368.1 PTS sugar transporter subunit IIB [Staphylococcus cohnii]MCE5100078.1 PTS sugar transporter subunit IIB [Staphylococcus cohnii]
MKVIMVCSGGMSSSMIVDAVKKEAAKENFDLEIVAVGTEAFENEIADYDLGLVAPQVRHRLDKFKKIGEAVNKPVDVIDPMGYTPIGAPKILKQIKTYV